MIQEDSDKPHCHPDLGCSQTERQQRLEFVKTTLNRTLQTLKMTGQSDLETLRPSLEAIVTECLRILMQDDPSEP